MSWRWTSFPEYMQVVDNGGQRWMLIPHSAVRYYAMSEASQEDQGPATPDQLATMQRLIREGLEAGALGLSITRNLGHFT